MGDEGGASRLQAQAHIWDLTFGYINSAAVKCAVDLRIPDIINTCCRPVTISEIMDSIINDGGAPSPDINYLSRFMRYLVRKRVFSAQADPSTGETLYGLTHSAEWLLSSSVNNDELTLAPFIQMNNSPWMMNPHHHMSDAIKDGGLPFVKEHGSSLWDYLSENPTSSRLFNDAMACTAKIVSKAILVNYKEGGGFDGVTSIVDVAGGTGTLTSEIVKANPQVVQAINFDLPHVIATAPKYPRVQHVVGDMFIDIPRADAVILKSILHDWNDEDCAKILRNCKKALLPADQNSGGGIGKVIIVDFVLRPDGNGLFDEVGVEFDMYMMTVCIYGKERTEQDWNKLLMDSGFSRYKIIQIPTFLSIIEAYPE